MKIQELEINQFKGIVSLKETNLNETVNVSGDNRTGIIIGVRNLKA